LEGRYLAMMMIDIPTPVSPPPYEYYQDYDCLMQRDDASIINSSCSIGAGKDFFRTKLKNGTEPWEKKRLYVILLDDDQLLIEPPSEEIKSLEEAQDDVLEETITFVDRLNPIREQLALSITQMSELLGVTRKSIYDWYDGIEPRSNTMTRLEILTKALQSISTDVDLRRLKVVWNIPVSGESFREVYCNSELSNGGLLEELIAKLNELKPNMVKKAHPVRKQTAQRGVVHLAELDKYAEFS